MAMCDERVMVGEDVLKLYNAKFEVVKKIYVDMEEGVGQLDYIVQLSAGDRKVTWCQGDPDLDYDYFNNYIGCIS